MALDVRDGRKRSLKVFFFKMRNLCLEGSKFKRKKKRGNDAPSLIFSCHGSTERMI